MPLVGKCAEFRRDGVANGAPQRAVEGCCVPDGLRKDSGAVGGTVDTVAAADTMEPLGPCASTESRIRATSLALALLAASWAGGCRVDGWLPDWLGGSLAGCHVTHTTRRNRFRGLGHLPRWWRAAQSLRWRWECATRGRWRAPGIRATCCRRAAAGSAAGIPSPVACRTGRDSDHSRTTRGPGAQGTVEVWRHCTLASHLVAATHCHPPLR